MFKKIGKKVITLLIAFSISIILSAVIAVCLNIVFMKQPEAIFGLTPIKIINELIKYKTARDMFILIILAFMSFAIISTFKLFKLNNYYAKTYKVTPDIEIPLPVGKNQTQHGSAWWLDKNKFRENFGVNTIDPLNPTIKELLDENSNKKVEPIFKKRRTYCRKKRQKYICF